MWIVADYGHGLISKNLAKQISSLDKFLAVNTQANAGNRGYNTITKYPRADFLSLNGGELQLELRDRNPDYEYIVPQYMKRLNSKYAVLTRGSKGMMVFSEEGSSIVPALGRRVLDKVGAGDSVLAIGSILARHDAPIEIIGLISSIVAAHEISQLGHRTSLKISDIKKAVKGLLG
jgi:bifunctional ADP-heptose synthase (sugar kinase/adenylyltransferase)